MVWQSNILNNCYELSGGYAPPEPPTRALPLDPAGRLPFPRPPCPPTRPPVPPTSKSWLRHCTCSRNRPTSASSALGVGYLTIMRYTNQSTHSLTEPHAQKERLHVLFRRYARRQTRKIADTQTRTLRYSAALSRRSKKRRSKQQQSTGRSVRLPHERT